MALHLLLIAPWLTAMVAIKLIVAPAIMAQWGWLGIVGTLIALLAFARWLDRDINDLR